MYKLNRRKNVFSKQLFYRIEYLSKCVDIVLSYNNVFYETEAN